MKWFLMYLPAHRWTDSSDDTASTRTLFLAPQGLLQTYAGGSILLSALGPLVLSALLLMLLGGALLLVLLVGLDCLWYCPHRLPLCHGELGDLTHAHLRVTGPDHPLTAFGFILRY